MHIGDITMENCFDVLVQNKPTERLDQADLRRGAIKERAVSVSQ